MDETTPREEPRDQHSTANEASSNVLPVARAEVLPMRRAETRPAKSGLRQLGELLEEAAGLTLDALDITGDMIAEKLGLRRTSTRADS